MRRRWVQDPVTLKMVEVNAASQDRSRRLPHVQKDIEPFVSHVDGTVVGSRRSLREHNKRNEVIQAAEWGNDDFCNRDAKREREEKLSGTNKKYNEQRKRDISRVIDRLS